MKLAKIKKFIGIMILITLINFSVPLISNATGLSFGDIKGEADSFVAGGKSNQKIDTATVISQLVPVGRILVGIGVVVLVVVGSILGVKYMTAGTNEKARNKTKTCILCYCSSINIWCSRHI